MKNLDGVPRDVLGQTIKRITAKKCIKAYEASSKPTALAKRKTARKAKKAAAPRSTSRMR